MWKSTSEDSWQCGGRVWCYSGHFSRYVMWEIYIGRLLMVPRSCVVLFWPRFQVCNVEIYIGRLLMVRRSCVVLFWPRFQVCNVEIYIGRQLAVRRSCVVLFWPPFQVCNVEIYIGRQLAVRRLCVVLFWPRFQLCRNLYRETVGGAEVVCGAILATIPGMFVWGIVPVSYLVIFLCPWNGIPGI